MDWWYQPQELEHLCAYKFYSQLESVNRNGNDKEFFEFQPGHPLRSVKVLVYRELPCVPVFSWNWLGSTHEFSQSLQDLADSDNVDYPSKEQHAKRFMILFLAFQRTESLVVDGSYQKKLQLALRENRVDDEMLQIAENLQSIHNSLASSMPENMLTTETDEYLEADDMEEMEEEDVCSESLEAMLLNIGSTLASSSPGQSLREECKDFSPTFSDTSLGQNDPIPWVSNNVIDTGQWDSIPENKSRTKDSSTRFRAPMSKLNSLVMQTCITKVEPSPQSGTESNGDAQSPSDAPRPECKVHANGTWQSIIAWGHLAKLDTEQQTAHEIMTATCVLTFVNEANPNVANSAEVEEQRRCLRKLARQENNTSKPLRLFVTGPAGAGKCECLLHVILHPFPLF